MSDPVTRLNVALSLGASESTDPNGSDFGG